MARSRNARAPSVLRVNFEAALEEARVHGRISADESGSAVTVWTDPGRALFSDLASLGLILERATPQRRAAASKAMAAFTKFQSTDAMVLQLIDVAPARSGAGVGSTFLTRLLAFADQTATAVYLNSSNERNHSFYDRLGFTPLGAVALGDDGPFVTAMLRPPKGRTKRASAPNHHD